MTTIYHGNGYDIETINETDYFSDNNTYRAKMKHKIKSPNYIKWDEQRGWIYKNGKELPWE